ncbi:aldo/keto reductase [Ktedonobacter sp. SOSP1-85]|uniref:aldo/keto reductase n=1 Tax=Ktedonobacter sp. SOSP1-85 TaxID=2778367 RepID=UPI00191574A0|nr:aldo/keto reductase [Ktedonobacter sp. SOSP1-85]GHO78432.1 aldo/keto reductase [Ktedonobacter sp. SOSP1-85]
MLRYEGASVYLGHAQISASRIGVGTWAIGGGWGPQPDNQSLNALGKALELGSAVIDTAPLYGNGHAERLIAQAFRSQGEKVTTLTKIYPLQYHWAPAPGTPIQTTFPAKHIFEQAEASLRRLETDCLDCLLFQTWCPSWAKETEWYETMVKLREQGKIRSFGISVSDHRAYEANEIIKSGLVDIIETPYNILDQRAAHHLFPLAVKHNVSIIARSPLASGALTGKWYDEMKFHRTDWRRRVFREKVLQRTLRRISAIKDLVEPGTNLAQVAIRFCLSHPAVTSVIPGVRSEAQVTCNLAALEQGPLQQTLLHQIERLWQEDFQYEVRTSVGEEGEG